MTTLICSIAIETFTHYYKEHLLFATLNIFVNYNCLEQFITLLQLDIFYLQHSKCQLKYEVLKLTNFLCTITIYKFFIQYCNTKLSYAQLILITFICTVTFDNIYRYYSNRNFCIYYCNQQHIITVLNFGD